MDTQAPYHSVVKTVEDLNYLENLAKNNTITEIAEILQITVSKAYCVLRCNYLKAKSPERPKKIKPTKIAKPKKDHTIAHWANYENHGKIRNIYYNMLKRCYKKENKAYKDYGARGIKVCEKWREDCCIFYKWAKENGYKEGLQLDRIDNNGDYSPENCHWVTPLENSYNKRNTRKLMFNGQVKTLLDWEKETNIPKEVLADRVYKYKWSAEKALTTPVRDHFSKTEELKYN